jgi:hypothetical protein
MADPSKLEPVSAGHGDHAEAESPAAVDSGDSRSQRDFGTVMSTFFLGHYRKRLAIFWPPIVSGLVLGSALGLVIPQVVATAIVAPMVLGYLAAGRFRSLRVDLDWQSAAPYQEAVTADLDDAARTAIAEAEGRVRARLKTPEAHLLVISPPEAHRDGACGWSCECAKLGITGSVVPVRDHPVLCVGERLLANAGLLRMVLEHEVRHLSRVLRWSRWLWTTLLATGGWALGLLLPPSWLLWAVPVLVAVLCLWLWAEEIACDLAAARRPGADAAGWYATARRVQRQMPHPGLLWLLAPTHPPLEVRSAIVTRLARPAPEDGSQDGRRAP